MYFTNLTYYKFNLKMKQITLCIAILLGCMTMNAQNIELSFDNATITNDGANDFYEVDVVITSDVA